MYTTLFSNEATKVLYLVNELRKSCSTRRNGVVQSRNMYHKLQTSTCALEKLNEKKAQHNKQSNHSTTTLNRNHALLKYELPFSDEESGRETCFLGHKYLSYRKIELLDRLIFRMRNQ